MRVLSGRAGLFEHAPPPSTESTDLIEGAEGEPQAGHIGGRVEAGAGVATGRVPLQLVWSLLGSSPLETGEGKPPSTVTVKAATFDSEHEFFEALNLFIM